MRVDFIRFEADDDVELQGWLSIEPGDTAAIHIHGMSGNGYENIFLDKLRSMYGKLGISFFSIDTRGRGIISDFRQGEGSKHAGSCFEIFQESIHDIQGSINYLKTFGKKKFILQGHSLGCTKVVDYLINHADSDVERVILLAPTDMTGWAGAQEGHREYLAKAKRLLAEGKGEELVGAQCWLDKTPISAQTYPSICEAGSPADVYGERVGGALLGKVDLPMLIPYGDADIGIEKIDGNIRKYLDRVDKIKNPKTGIAVIEGASHNFKDHEDELVFAIEKFIKSK